MRIWLLMACARETSPVRPDGDGDGWADGVDCDDGDPAIHPGAVEVCGNGTDDDCDLEAPGCGMYGEVVLAVEAQGASADAGLGSVLAGGSVPMATAPGVGVLRVREGTWLPSTSPGFGASLASSGEEVLVGAPDVGTVLLVGADTWTLTGVAAEGAGSAVTFVGDDVAIGAPDAGEGAEGAVYVLAAPDGDRALEGADAVVLGVDADVRDGASIAGGDLDGDGVGDLAVVGTPVADEGAFAWVVAGPLSGTILLADADATLAARHAAEVATLAGPCDVNGDGAPDLLLSLSTSRTLDWGTSWDYSTLAVTASTLDWFFEAASANGQAERPACGDADGDGLAEVARADTRNGWVEVDSGAWRDVAWAAIPEDEPATVAFALDDDGYADLLVGLPASDLGASDGGGVWSLAGGAGF